MAKAGKKRLFYSPIKGLRISMGKGHRVIEDGQSKLIEDPEIQFTPLGQDHYGMLATDDPDVIAFLEKRMAAHGSRADVLTEEQFGALVIPKDEQIAALAKKLDEKVAENNRLLALLNEQQKDQPPAPPPTPSRMVTTAAHLLRK